MTYLHTRLAQLCRAFPDVPLPALQAAMIEGINSWDDPSAMPGELAALRTEAIQEVMEFRREQ